MLINDNFIIKYFYKPKTYKFLIKEKLNNIPDNILNYLNNRFNDSYSIEETICRIRFILDGIKNLEEKPKCPICGKPVIFLYKKTKLFTKHCSLKCKQINTEKQINTCQKKYGGNAPICNKEILNKVKNTKLHKYGNEYFNNREKSKKTCLEKYNFDNPSKNQEVKEKLKESQYKLYGSFAFNTYKQKETMIKKYGVDTYLKTKECIKKAHTKEIQEKRYNTKKENGTLGGRYSKMENTAYDLISYKFKDTIRWYKDNNRYPFECDMYIPSLDLFIECQFHQTHGKHPYNENSIEDQKYKKQLEKYFNSDVWCIRDPYKRKIAKENNINFKEFWSLIEIKKWLLSIE